MERVSELPAATREGDRMTMTSNRHRETFEAHDDGTLWIHWDGRPVEQAGYDRPEVPRNHIGPDVEFVTMLLVTDTVTYEIVGRTASTMKVRTTKGGERGRTERRDGNPLPIVYTFCEPDPDGKVSTVRRRKDGTFRMGEGFNPLRPTLLIDGRPVSFTDYRA